MLMNMFGKLLTKNHYLDDYIINSSAIRMSSSESERISSDSTPLFAYLIIRIYWHSLDVGAAKPVWLPFHCGYGLSQEGDVGKSSAIQQNC
jgi:hypothetical protein